MSIREPQITSLKLGRSWQIKFLQILQFVVSAVQLFCRFSIVVSPPTSGCKNTVEGGAGSRIFLMLSECLHLSKVLRDHLP